MIKYTLSLKVINYQPFPYPYTPTFCVDTYHSLIFPEYVSNKYIVINWALVYDYVYLQSQHVLTHYRLLDHQRGEQVAEEHGQLMQVRHKYKILKQPQVVLLDLSNTQWIVRMIRQIRMDTLYLSEYINYSIVMKRVVTLTSFISIYVFYSIKVNFL